MTSQADAVMAELAALGRLYQAELNHCMEAIDRSCRELPKRLSPSRAEPLIRDVHSIAGTSGTLGHPRVSMAAASLETALVKAAAGRSSRRREIMSKLDELRAEIARLA